MTWLMNISILKYQYWFNFFIIRPTSFFFNNVLANYPRLNPILINWIYICKNPTDFYVFSNRILSYLEFSCFAVFNWFQSKILCLFRLKYDYAEIYWIKTLQNNFETHKFSLKSVKKQ